LLDKAKNGCILDVFVVFLVVGFWVVLEVGAMVNSKRKGKRGELEAAKVLREVLGVEARRGVQYKGTQDSPDIEIDLPIHVEVKLRERLNVYEAYQQSVSQAGEKIPVVMCRKNRTKWLLVIAVEDIPRFLFSLQSRKTADEK